MKNKQLSKKFERELIKKWSKLDSSQKCKYNGFDGYCNNKFYAETSLFKGKRKYQKN